MRTEDGHIVRRCLAGEPSAFALLVDKYRSDVHALAFSKLGDFHDAEDIAQEVFLKAYRKLHTLRRWDQFYAWIYSITSNLCKNHVRARGRRRDKDLIEDQSSNLMEHLSIDYYRRRMLSESVNETLDILPETYREVLVLYYLGGMKTREISRFLGVSNEAIKKRLSRARERFKAEDLNSTIETLESQKLSASFTFRILEAVKHIRIKPLPRMTGLPWGLLSATGILLVILSTGSHLNLVNPESASYPRSDSGQMKVTETQGFIVELMEISSKQAMSNEQYNGPGKSPVLLGEFRFPGAGQQVRVIGDYAYVTDGAPSDSLVGSDLGFGFHVINISNPSNPHEIGFCDTPGEACGFCIAGNYAYVANAETRYNPGLSVIDISNSENPQQVGFVTTSGPYQVQVVGNYAYVADGYKSGLCVIDVSSPANPRQVGSYYTTQYATGIDVVGNRVYLANGSEGLHIIDVSDPENPRRLGTYGTRWALRVHVVGDHAYLTDEQGLYVIDISDPRNPCKVGYYSNPGPAFGVQVVGNYAYVAAGDSGLRIIDISDPANLREVAFRDQLGRTIGIHVTDDYVYMAGLDGLHILKPELQ
jgi:RNA polymerase sigma factor (sigma-70 family)